MRIDRGFFVNNFVGTYEIKHVPEQGCEMIISKEINHADEEKGERLLQKRRIFESDESKPDYISLHLANVDIHSDDSILEFCNKYGLPYSSQICCDREQGIGPDINPALATEISKRHAKGKYDRQDFMDRLEFCCHAVLVNRLLKLKSCLDRRDKLAIYEELIPLLTYFIFYSREIIFAYDDDDIKQQYPGMVPKSRIMSFQYGFQMFRHRNEGISLLPSAHQIVYYIAAYEYKLKHPEIVHGPLVLSDINAEENQHILKIFKRIFIKDSYQEKFSREISHSWFGFEIDSDKPDEPPRFVTNNKELLENVRNSFHVDEYNCITFDDKIDYTGDLSELVQLGYAVIRDAINEGITSVMPELVLEGRKLRGEWQLNFQMEGIYMELFFQLASNTLYRICENPKCNNFFAISGSRATRKYCSDECGAACRQARRRQSRRGANSHAATNSHEGE